MLHHMSRDHTILVEGLALLGKITLTPLHGRAMDMQELGLVMKKTTNMMMGIRPWRMLDTEEKMEVHWDLRLGGEWFRKEITDIV